MSDKVVPQNVLEGSVAFLKPYYPILTTDRLVHALETIRDSDENNLASTEIGSLPSLVDKRAAAKVLGFSIYTIVKMCKSGELKAKKISNRWRISVEAIKEISKQRQPGTA